MSLINDALKRARLEARRQDEDGGKREYRALPAHSRHPERQRRLLVAGWSVAALAVAAAVALWLAAPAEDALDTGKGPGDLAGRGPVPQPAVPAPAVPAPPVVDPRRASGGSAGSAPETTSESGEGMTDLTSGSEPVERSVASEGESPGSEAKPQRPTEGSDERPRAGSPRLREGATYLRQVRSADGSVVALGGIAYSETRPIAVINGSVVSNGDLIAGFTVVAVEPEQVELEVDGVRFYLALR